MRTISAGTVHDSELVAHLTDLSLIFAGHSNVYIDPKLIDRLATRSPTQDEVFSFSPNTCVINTPELVPSYAERAGSLIGYALLRNPNGTVVWWLKDQVERLTRTARHGLSNRLYELEQDDELDRIFPDIEFLLKWSIPHRRSILFLISEASSPNDLMDKLKNLDCK